MLRLKDLREDRDLTQEDLAKVLCISQAQYSRIERGKYQLDYEGLRKLAIFYNTSIDYILGLTNVIKYYPRVDM